MIVNPEDDNLASKDTVELLIEKPISWNETNIELPEIVNTFKSIALGVRKITQLIDTENIQDQDRKLRANMTNEQVKLSLLLENLGDEIDDFIDENAINDCASVMEVEENVTKIELFRTRYRAAHSEYKMMVAELYEESLKMKYEYQLEEIKKYIMQGKDFKRKLKMDESLVERKANTRSGNVIISEINTLSGILIETFVTDNIEYTDDEISKLQNDMPENVKKVETISNLIKDLLVCSKRDEIADNRIDQITKDYDKLCRKMEKYVKFVNQEMKDRQISKKEWFKEGKLKIHLPKFTGLESEMDIYTFQNEFIKIHETTTIKRIMCDVLKNNFLEGTALSLVENVDDIDEIWSRLKTVYGDPDWLLKRKLGEIEKVNNLGKTHDPEKLGNSLCKLINIMMDLIKLGSEHDIKSKLYSGDGLDRIYLQMGDDRLNKWLSRVVKDERTDEQLWKDLIIFLENDLRVQQQKLEFDNPDSSSGSKGNDTKSDKYGAHFVENVDYTKCFICDEEDHIATLRRHGTKIIQYFACKKFASMTPNERFLALKDKEYCIQCLFPGASQTKGKHKMGHCQHDFVCQHISHDKFPVKKHVLICHEHRNSKENLELLETFKEQCINKYSADLPQFSREIKLSFHTSSQQPNKNRHLNKYEDGNDENAIYMLQTIDMENNPYSIIYDTGCSEMVSRYEATQEMPGPAVLGGVGNSQMTSQYGTYQVRLPMYNGEVAKFNGACMDQITAEFPMYPLDDVEEDINDHYKEGNIKQLAQLPKSVGGYTDFTIGIEYHQYYPELIHQLPSGLAIYQSVFLNTDGSQGVVGGPHRIFTEINSNYYDPNTFISSQYQIFRY